MQGGSDASVEALSRGDVAGAGLDDRERGLMEFVELLTRHSYRTTDETVQQLRELGWSDEEIAEAVYVTALFALFNRVADAFGLENPMFRERAAEGEAVPRPAEKASPDD